MGGDDCAGVGLRPSAARGAVCNDGAQIPGNSDCHLRGNPFSQSGLRCDTWPRVVDTPICLHPGHFPDFRVDPPSSPSCRPLQEVRHAVKPCFATGSRASHPRKPSMAAMADGDGFGRTLWSRVCATDSGGPWPNAPSRRRHHVRCDSRATEHGWRHSGHQTQQRQRAQHFGHRCDPRTGLGVPPLRTAGGHRLQFLRHDPGDRCACVGLSGRRHVFWRKPEPIAGPQSAEPWHLRADRHGADSPVRTHHVRQRSLCELLCR